jgi:ATP-dependent DNA helicase RecG
MMPDRVIEILRSKYLVAPIHYEGMQRKEPLEIPENGLREMICNAIIHKDYTGTFIQMKVFDDYITLWNGGMLPPNYSVEKLMQPHESHPRNRLMANVFYLAGFIEAWGRGYEKIRDAFKAEDLEMPVFEEVRGGFMATIKREKFMDIQKGKNFVKDFVKDFAKDLSERQKVILELINDNPFVSAKEISEKISEKTSGKTITERTIQTDIAKLKKMGYLTREGGRKEGRWIIIVTAW